jgi:hypothetical protein
MAEQIHDQHIQGLVDRLSSKADKSSKVGSAAGVLGIIAGAVLVAPAAGAVLGLTVGLGGAVIAGIALARKLRLEKNITDVEGALQGLNVDQQKLLAVRLSELQTGQVTAESVGKIVGEITL